MFKNVFYNVFPSYFVKKIADLREKIYRFDIWREIGATLCVFLFYLSSRK